MIIILILDISINLSNLINKWVNKNVLCNGFIYFLKNNKWTNKQKKK